jgi:hypothetical protein
MSDPVTTYNDAKQKLESAAQEVGRIIGVLRQWHDTLANHWKRTIISGTNGPYSMSLTLLSHESLNAHELPKALEEVPSKSVEIERRRCNLSLIPKTGTSPTKGEHRHEAADHNRPAAVKSLL